ELGPTHISADIGCHSFATFAPFSMGNSILGYGMSLASAAAVGPNMSKRPIAIMGDGGFWHNGLITGVASNLFNKGDGVLIVMQNGYASATGQQYIPSSTSSRDGPTPGVDIEICTGDHSCIRLSGCPSLTLKPSPDPLRSDPVATVIESCVGCGLCGEVAHAAVLCPSFYRAEIVRNPTLWDRFIFRLRQNVIG